MDPSIKYWLDIVGAVFSFASTLFYIKIDKRAWPIGLCAIGINIFLYYQTGIYGDMSLEIVYFVLTFYGWYQWMWGGGNHDNLPITHLTPKLGLLLSFIAGTGSWACAILLIKFTHSQVPYWDAITTVLSLIAQWMICKKILETWVVWLVVDAMYVGLYFNKALPFHSALLVIYCGLAIVGWWRWRKQCMQNQGRHILIDKPPLTS